MKKTFKELLEVDRLVGKLYQKDPLLEDGKFGYGYKRFFEKNMAQTQKEYGEALLEVRIEHALEDEKTKALLKDPNPKGRGFQYSKEGFKALIKAEKEVEEQFMTKEIEIEPYIIKNPPLLTEEQAEAFSGLLIEAK